MDAGKMMKKDVFTSFAEKARKKLEEKKKQRTEKLHIPDLGETITITALTDQELAEIMGFSEDDNENDKYMIYMSSPELQELAKELKENGDIEKYHNVTDIFKRADRRKIAKKILELSGVYEESTVTVISETEEIKKQ